MLQVHNSGIIICYGYLKRQSLTLCDRMSESGRGERGREIEGDEEFCSFIRIFKVDLLDLKIPCFCIFLRVQ